MGFIGSLIIYILGGLTFLPILLSLILLHAYLLFPRNPPTSSEPHPFPQSIRDPADDGHNLKSEKAIANLPDQFQRSHEPDVAAGYFAVCREYVPGGINGKPPERTTPAGAVVAMESPSVYQTMYRSIFDRRNSPSLELGKGNGKTIKRARNVFFVVLRHGHLMLYDDSEQLEVRHVISLEHHYISIYGGEEIIPEGELWIKRNAICLARKANTEEGTSNSKPFYLFSENCSEKEDFYFALLQNQEVKPQGRDNPPRPQLYEVKHMIGLVQKLHSSEEHLQTRWINALVGRAFLALYKTQEIEDFVRRKISKKIARVKKPAFLSSILLQKIDMGESGPYITNPRLKDLTVDGECCVEADVKYNGNFRLELAATARIELGSRFKAREVNLVLAVVVKTLEGHVLVRFKPSPSNRVWIAFDKMPEMEMSIEPVVSSRQITYNIILRAIESRIREVIAETVVLPHWDDSPFLDTGHQEFRGGIWARASTSSETANHTTVPSEEPVGENNKEDDKILLDSPSLESKADKLMSMPVLAEATSPDPLSTKAVNSRQMPAEVANQGASTGSEKGEKPPMAMRSRSFASAANPLVSLDSVNVDSVRYNALAQEHQDASSVMMALSNRPQTTSPTETPIASLPDSSTLWEKSRDVNSPTTSKASSVPEQIKDRATLGNQDLVPTTPTRTTSHSLKVMNGNFGSHEDSVPQNTYSTVPSEKGQSLAALGAATAAAKRWGWGVLSRSNENKNISSEKTNNERAGTREHPIGRGRPLPPPGQPLPFPDRPSSKILHNNMVKRKSLHSPVPPHDRQDESKVRPVSKTPLQGQKTSSSQPHNAIRDEALMIVEAPSDSESPSPTDHNAESSTGNLEPVYDDGKNTEIRNQEDAANTVQIPAPAELPSSRHASSSYEEHNGPLASWQSAQEEELRSQSISIESNEHS
jgi:hypothetical protein